MPETTAQPQDARTRIRNRVSAAARWTVDMAGSPHAATAAVALAVVWVAIGMLAGFSEHWLSVLVAVTGLLTFVMVFFIQHATGRESRAVLLKLDELLRATTGARNDVIAAEHRPLHEQEHLEDRPSRTSQRSTN